MKSRVIFFRMQNLHFYSNKFDECEYEYNPSVQCKQQWKSPKIFMNLQFSKKGSESMLPLALLLVALPNIQGKIM